MESHEAKPSKFVDMEKKGERPKGNKRSGSMTPFFIRLIVATNVNLVKIHSTVFGCRMLSNNYMVGPSR
jgi:hypothetical protein